MKTDELINMLSTQAGPAPKVSVAKRLVAAGISGGLIASATILGMLGLVPDEMFFESGLWIKLAYASALTLAAALLVARLGKPGASNSRAVIACAAVMAVMLLAGILSYLATPEYDRATALLGHSWLVCPWAILGLSLPVMAGSFWAMKALAPTHLEMAGAACGLFSGSVAAIAYSLACTEPAAPFIAAWYTLGIVLCGLLGAALGQKFLNW